MLDAGKDWEEIQILILFSWERKLERFFFFFQKQLGNI